MMIDWELAGSDKRLEIEVTQVERTIGFYRDVLRAREVFRLKDSEKRPIRIGFTIGNLGFSVVSVEQRSQPPATLSALAEDLGFPFLAVVLRVDDPDLIRREAIAAGSKPKGPPGIGQPCIIGDPFGTHWAITRNKSPRLSGIVEILDETAGGIVHGQSAPEFFVLKPANGEPATFANGGTISFASPDRAAVAAFHRAALVAGAKDEGAVGPRDWAPHAYAAYARDLGNKIAAYCFKAE